jgi:hypothetical protein
MLTIVSSGAGADLLPEVADDLDDEGRVIVRRPPVDEGGPESNRPCPASRADIHTAVHQHPLLDLEIQRVESLLRKTLGPVPEADDVNGAGASSSMSGASSTSCATWPALSRQRSTISR